MSKEIREKSEVQRESRAWKRDSNKKEKKKFWK